MYKYVILYWKFNRFRDIIKLILCHKFHEFIYNYNFQIFDEIYI